MGTLTKGLLGLSGVLWGNQAYDFRGDVEAICVKRENLTQVDIGLKVGIFANSDTLAGVSEDELPTLYPAKSRLSSLIREINSYDCLSICHFEALRYGSLRDECLQMAQGVGNSFGGFQLVTDWPDPWVVADLKNALPEKEIILQVGMDALNKFFIRGSRSNKVYYADEIALKVKEYTNHISEVVICPSSSGYPAFNPQKLVPVIEQLMGIKHFRLSVSTGKLIQVPEIMGPLFRVCPNLGYTLDLTGVQGRSDHLHHDRVDLYMQQITDVMCQATEE